MVYSMFIAHLSHLINKTYVTHIEGKNTRLRHDLARLHRQTLCYSKSTEMLKTSVLLLLHYLKYFDYTCACLNHDLIVQRQDHHLF